MNIKIPLYFLIAVCSVVISVFIYSAIVPGTELIQTNTSRFLANILSMGVMIQSAIFSLLLIKQSESNRKNSDEVNARSEAFRNFQFIASNYTTVDFFDSMTLYRESQKYIDRLKERMDFKFYMRQDGISFDDIKKNLDEYVFLTVKLPLKIVVGDAVARIRFYNFRLDRDDVVHSFVPCCDGFQGLILWNEKKQRQELSLNLIAQKDSDFFCEDTVTPFTKIKVFLSMHSVLGVVVKGWTELYFTNPQKRERDGANKYIINSTQFNITSLPELETSIDAMPKAFVPPSVAC